MISFEVGRPTPPPFRSSRYQLRRLPNLSTQCRLLYSLHRLLDIPLPNDFAWREPITFKRPFPNKYIPAETGITSFWRISTASWASPFVKVYRSLSPTRVVFPFEKNSETGIPGEHGLHTETSSICCGSTTILTVSQTDKVAQAPITGAALFKVMLSR